MEKMKRIINNFTLGVALLVLAYVFVYYWGSSNVYLQVISSFQNVKSLISQCLFAGILVVIMSEVLDCADRYEKKIEKKQVTLKELIGFIVEIIILCVVFVVIVKVDSLPSIVQSVYMFNIIMALIIRYVASTIQKAIEIEILNKYIEKRDDKKSKN